MEQCKEKFVFVEIFMTGNSVPVVQRGMLCGKTGHTRKGRGSWTCPAESVVVTCCAAPDKDMARKTQVMESKKCRRHSKIEERGTHSIDRMVERKKHRKETRSWKGSTWTRTNKDFFFYTGGQDTSRGQARIHKQRWPYEQEVYNGGEKREENKVRSATEYTRDVSLIGDGKRRSRSSKNTKTGCQQM